MIGKQGVLAFVGVALVAGAVLLLYRGPVQGEPQGGGGGNAGPRYSVVHTEGTNLIVVDNKVNTIYFYTIEPEGKPGDDLILRGSADLNQVGKDKITPTLIHPKKKKDGAK